MISRRGVILAASSLVLTLCASCGDAGVTGDDNEESGSGSLEATRKHISSDNVVGVFLFSLDGQSIAAIGADDLQEAIEILCDLDSETSEEPAAVPEGGSPAGGSACSSSCLSHRRRWRSERTGLAPYTTLSHSKAVMTRARVLATCIPD